MSPRLTVVRAGTRHILTSMRITSQNVKHLPLMSRGKVRHDEKLTLAQSDVVGWQELQNDHGYWDYLREMETHGWETYAGAGIPVPGHLDPGDDPDFDRYYSTPISWRTGRYAFVTGGRRLLTKGVGGIAGNRYLTWVTLRGKATGKTFTVVNVHMPVRKTRAGRKLWAQGFADLIAFVATLDGPVVITGDFNARAVTMRPRPKSWRVRFPLRIDHVILVGAWNKATAKILGGRFSDHPGARLTVTLT